MPACCNTDTTQFADDVTTVKADENLEVVVSSLTEAFGSINQFCEEHGLRVNADKTQLIVFKAPWRKIPDIHLK